MRIILFVYFCRPKYLAMIHYNKEIREQGNTPLRQTQLIMLEIVSVIDKICQKHQIEYWLDFGTLLGAVRHKGFIPWDDDLDIAVMRDDYYKLLEILKEELPEDLFLQTRYNDHSKWKFAKVRDNYSTIIQKSELKKNVKYHQGIFVDIFPYDYCENPKTFARKKNILNRRFKSGKGIIRKSGNFMAKMLSTLLVKTVGFDRLRDYFLQTEPKSTKYITRGIDTYSTYDSFKTEVIFPLKKIEFEGILFPVPNDFDQYLTIEFGDYMTIPKESERQTHAHQLLPFQACQHQKAMQYK